MPDDQHIPLQRLRVSVRAARRSIWVLVTTTLLFLTLAVAGQAARLVPAQEMADVSIVKVDASPNVRPGGTLSYQILYENEGPVPAHDVVITDTLPAHTSHSYDDAGAQGWTVTVNGDTVVWYRDVLSATLGGNFDVVLQVDADAPAGAALINHAAISTASEESDYENNTDATSESIVRVADVRITQQGPAEVDSGDTLTYTIEFANEGSEAADDVFITDTLPAGVSLLAWDGDPPLPPDIQGNRVVWEIGTLIVGAAGDLTVVGQPDAPHPSYTSLTNTLRISTQTPERDTADNVTTSTAVVRAGPPDSLQLSVPPTITVNTTRPVTARVLDRWDNPVIDGTNVSFTGDALVTPGGSAVTVDGVATTTLAAGPQVGLAALVAEASSLVVTETLEVVPGPVGQLDLTANENQQTAGESVTLRGEVFDGFGNPVEAGIAVSFTTTLGEVEPPAADTDAAGLVTATLVSTRTGTAIASVWSNGFQDSTAIQFEPAGPAHISVAADPPTVTVDGDTSRIVTTLFDHFGNRVGDGIPVAFASSLGTINPAAASTVAGQASTILTSGPIHGLSVITASVGAYTGTTGVPFLPADLLITSTHTPSGDILPGTAVTYTLVFKNEGAAVAKEVVITNTLPAGFSDTSFASSGASITTREGSAYVWDVEDLSAGEGGTITLWGRFDPSYAWPPSQLVSNIARIASATAEGNPSDNNTSAGNVIVTSDVFIQIAVDDAGTQLEPGKTIKYLVSWGNYERPAADGVVITSTLPAYTRLRDWAEIWPHSPGLQLVSQPESRIQVWEYDGAVDSSNFGEFYILLDIDPAAPGGATLRNHIEIQTDTPEGNDSNNQRTVERRLSGVNLRVQMTGSETVVPGHLLTYTLRYTNTGTLPAENVVMTSTLPAGFSLEEAGGEPNLAADHVVWELGTVNEGQWRQFTVVGQIGTDVPAGELLHNDLEIRTPSAESFVGDNAAVVETEVVPDHPASLVLTLEPTTMPTGATHPLRVDVGDQFGNPIDGLSVTLTTTVGVVVPPVATTVQGAAGAEFQAPTSPAEGTVTALAAGLSDSVAVTVEPGPPSQLTVESEDDELPADGESTTVIRAYVHDAYGNRVQDGASVLFETDRGTLYNGQSQHTVGTVDGFASTVLQAGQTAGLARVSVSAGTVARQITIQFTALPTPTPSPTPTVTPTPAPKYRVRLPLIARSE